MEQNEGLMQIVQFSKNKQYVNIVEKLYIYIKRRPIRIKRITNVRQVPPEPSEPFYKMNSTTHARMYEPHNKQHDHSWQWRTNERYRTHEMSTVGVPQQLTAYCFWITATYFVNSKSYLYVVSLIDFCYLSP
jgi:hypothetical protein